LKQGVLLLSALTFLASCMRVQVVVPPPCNHVPETVETWINSDHSSICGQSCLPTSPDSDNNVDLIFTGRKKLRSRLHGWEKHFPNIPTLLAETSSKYVIDYLQGDLTEGDLFSPFSEWIAIVDKRTGQTLRVFRADGTFKVKLLYRNALYLKLFNQDQVYCFRLENEPITSVNILPQRQSSPLIQSIKSGNYQHFLKLLASDADPLEPMMNGEGNALDEAVSKSGPKNKATDSRYLYAILSKLQKEKRINENVRLSLIRANEDIFFEVLDKYHINVNAPIDRGDGTFLMYACYYAGRSGTRISKLISRGANINAATNAGFTPLMWSIGNADLNMIKTLLKNGADIRARTVHGMTPLMKAVKSADPDTVRLLLEMGANPKAVDNYNRTVKDYLPNRMNKKDRANILRQLKID
jgi:ankyrin repeat protein